MLNAIDRFIASLWSRNDQLSVYNPQLKTMYDTHSWETDIRSTTDEIIAKAIGDYKLDLFISLEHNDILPLTYSTNEQGRDFMLAYLGRDVRNIIKWLKKSQRGFEKLDVHHTYTEIDTYIKGPPAVPLGSRGVNGMENLGFLKSAFYQMVQENFTIGRYGTDMAKPIFGDKLEDDYQFAFSNYFWFMYGILPRNGIKFKTLERGLTIREGLERFEIEDTIKFLALVFNVPPEVTITIDNSVVKDLKLINPYQDVYRPFRRDKIEIRGKKLVEPTGEREKPQGVTTKAVANNTTETTDPKVTELYNKWKELETEFNALKTSEKEANKSINIGTEMTKVGTKLYVANQKMIAAKKAYDEKKKEIDAKKKSPAPAVTTTS